MLAEQALELLGQQLAQVVGLFPAETARFGVEASRIPSGLKTRANSRTTSRWAVMCSITSKHTTSLERAVLEREVAQVGPFEAHVRRDSLAYRLEHVLGQVDADDTASPRVGQHGRAVGDSASRVEHTTAPCC